MSDIELTARWRLAPYMRFCEVDDGAIFLNLRTSQYLSLDRQQLEVMKALVAAADGAAFRNAESAHSAAANTLVSDMRKADALIRESSSKNSVSYGFRTRSEPPRSTVEEILRPTAYSVRPGLVDILRFVFASMEAWARLRFQNLESVVSRLEKAIDATTRDEIAPDAIQVANVVERFRRIRPFVYTAKDRCLYDSLVLVLFIRKYGYATTLVIGVDTRPFRAHSWAQFGDVVLNEALYAACDHVPILAVG